MQVNRSGSPFSAPVPSTHHLTQSSSANDPSNRRVTLVSSDEREFSIVLSLLKSCESLYNPFIHGIVEESITLSLSSLTLSMLIDFLKNYNNPDQLLRWESFRDSLLGIHSTLTNKAEKEERPEGDFLHELQSLYLFSDLYLINDLSNFILRFIQNEDVLKSYSNGSFEILLSHLETSSDSELAAYKILWHLAIKEALLRNDSVQIKNLFSYFIKQYGQDHLKSLIEPLDQKEKLLFLFINKLLEDLDNEAASEYDLDAIYDLLDNCNFWTIFKNSSWRNVPLGSGQIKELWQKGRLLPANGPYSPIIKVVNEQPQPSTKTTQFFIILKQLIDKVSNQVQALGLINKTLSFLDDFLKKDFTEQELGDYNQFFKLTNHQEKNRFSRWQEIVFNQILFSLISNKTDPETIGCIVMTYLTQTQALDSNSKARFFNCFIESLHDEFLNSKPCTLSEYLQKVERFSEIIIFFNMHKPIEIGKKIKDFEGYFNRPTITKFDLQNPEEVITKLANTLPVDLFFIARKLAIILSSHMPLSEETRDFFNINENFLFNPPRTADSTIITPKIFPFAFDHHSSLKKMLIDESGKPSQSLRSLKRVHEAFNQGNLMQTQALLQEKNRSKNENFNVQFIKATINRGEYDKSFDLANTFEKSDRRTCFYLILTSLCDEGNFQKFDELRSKLELYKDIDSQEININLLIYEILKKYPVIAEAESVLPAFVKQILVPKLQKIEKKNKIWDTKVVLILLAKLLSSNNKLLLESIFEFPNLNNIAEINRSDAESKKWHIQDFILPAKLYLGDIEYLKNTLGKSRSRIKPLKPLARALNLMQELVEKHPDNSRPILNPSMIKVLWNFLDGIFGTKTINTTKNLDLHDLLHHLLTELLLNIRHFQEINPKLAEELVALVQKFNPSLIKDINIIFLLLLMQCFLGGEIDPAYEQILPGLLANKQFSESTISDFAVKLALENERYKKLFIGLMNIPELASIPKFAVTYYTTLKNTLPKNEFYLFTSEIPLSIDHAFIAHFSFDLSSCKATYHRISESAKASKNCFHFDTAEPEVSSSTSSNRKRKRSEKKKEKVKEPPKVKRTLHETSSAKRKAHELGEKEKQQTPLKREKGKEKLPN